MKRAAAFLLICLLPVSAWAGDFQRGLQALNEQDYDLALHFFTVCIEEKPHDLQAYLKRGQVYSLQEDYERAIEDYTEALEIDPKNSIAYTAG